MFDSATPVGGNEATYAKWNALSEQKDVDQLLAMLHPDFQYTDETGRVEAKGAFGARIRQALSASRNIHYGTKIQSPEGHDDEATSQIIYSVQMEYQKGDEWVPVQCQIHSSEKFVRVNGRWMLRSSRVLK